MLGEGADERAFRNGVKVLGCLALILGMFVVFQTLSQSLVERLRQISEGIDPDEAGKTSRYKEGHARPRPKKNKPLSRKKNAQRSARAKAQGEKNSTTSKRGRK